MDFEQEFRVYIADDPISIIGLSQLFDGRIGGCASDGSEALRELLAYQEPIVAVLGSCLPGLTGPQVIRKLHEAEAAATPILIACSCHTIDFVEAVANGLMGFTTRSPKAVIETVKKVANGETALGSVHSQLIGGLRDAGRPSKLTPREREILTFVADGMTTKRIAKEIFIAEPTIKFHLQHLLKARCP